MLKTYIENRSIKQVSGIKALVLLVHYLISYMYVTKKIVSEYDQEIPHSQTADNPVAPRGRAAQPSQDTRKTN